MNVETDDEIVDQHHRAVAMLTPIIIDLVRKFGPIGVTPMVLMEASLKASALAMTLHCGSKPPEIADLLDDAAAAVRAMPDDALQPETVRGRAN
jgi:hypothetical protein